MNRRSYLAGLGSIAAGTAMLGTAATSTFSVNGRTANINIARDNPAGAIGFDIQNSSGVINESGAEGAEGADGEVEIDLGEATGTSEIGDGGAPGSGINVGSVVTVGEINRTDSSKTDPSLKISNQSSSPLEFTFDFSVESSTGLGQSDLNLAFEFQDNKGNVEEVFIDGSGTNNSITSGDGIVNGTGSNLADLNDLGSSEAYDFALTVDAEGASPSADVDIDLDITAVDKSS